MRPLIAIADVRQSGMPRVTAEHDDTADRLFETVLGVVVDVYPIDHPQNDMGQMLVDVQPLHWAPMLRRVPLAVGYAHGETHVATANTRDRQPYAPKARNQMDGTTYDVRPGTRVQVAFISGDLAAPIVVGIVKFNRQGELDAPTERQGIDRFGDDGHFAMVEGNPLDSAMSEYPRHRDTYNGTSREVDNRGNYTVQTSTDQEPVHPGHNGIDTSPDPQGNILHSSRGAKVGRQGRLTGKHPITGEAGDGTIRDETLGATKGSWVARLASTIGRLWFSTRGSGDGRVYLENDDRSYVSLKGETASLHAKAKAFLDAAEVCLGNADPQYHAVLWEPLREMLFTFITDYDGHMHTGVESGSDNSGPPAIGFLPKWLLQFQLGTTFESDHVRLVKSEAASPTFETDPDGGDAGGPPEPPPSPPPPSGPPRRRPSRGHAGVGVFS